MNLQDAQVIFGLLQRVEILEQEVQALKSQKQIKAH